MIRLQVLGSIELEDPNGRELRAVLAQPKRFALLAYLAATPRAFHRRDTLLGLLWPELDERRGRDALNQAIRFLRRQLGSDVVVSRGDEYVGTDAGRLWCDAAAFREHAEAGRNGEALELYRGDLLAGFFTENGAGFEEWVERERAHLRASAAKVARALAEARERDGGFTTAVASARRAVELSDADERVVRGLLELLERLGDRAGAIHAYDAFARRLTEEFGAEPDPETQALMNRIRLRASATGRPPAVVARLHDQRAPAVGVAPGALGAAAAVGDREVVTTPLTPPSGEPGSELGGWRIERELGRGGMATVYLARDPKHDRHVAVKVLRPELAVSLGAERFLREIQIMARLAHPHILPLIDSGAANGVLYLVAPYIAGESLRDRLAREGRLGVEEALEITREVASALDYAHRHGVVHRDIKPANILLQDGRAVVADFGVALALSASGGERVTATGLSPGTPSYMSPEQAAGESGVDARSDVYSLGCVLYEMLTGQPPHAGPDARAVLARVLSEPARPAGALRAEVPPHVEGALTRALAKAPAERFPTAAELARALSGVSMAPRVPGLDEAHAPAGVAGTWLRIRIAGALALATLALFTAVYVALYALGIVPRASLLASGVVAPQERVLITDFHVSGADSTFGRPFGAAVRTALAQSRELTIVAPEAVASALERMRRPRNALVDLSTAREIALREGLRAIVDGHVVRTGRTFAVGLRLVAADSGKELVTLQEVVDGVDEILPTLDQLTRQLRQRIGESLERVRATPPLPQLTTQSLEALRLYDEHLRVRDQRAALSLLIAAVKADSEFAEGWRRIHVLRGNLGLGGPEWLAAITKAYEYSSKLPDRERIPIAAQYHNARGDRAQAIELFQRGLDLGDTSNSPVNLADLVESRREFERAEALDRLVLRRAVAPGPGTFANLAGRLMQQGRLREAAATLDSGLLRSPNAWPLQRERIRLLYLSDSLDAYARVLDSVRALPDLTKRRSATSQRRDLALLRGQLAEWKRLWLDARSLDSAGGVALLPVSDVWGVAQADLFVRGDTGGAVTRLSRAVEERMMRLGRGDHCCVARGYLLWGAFLAIAGHTDQALRYRTRYDSMVDPARRPLNEPWVHRLLAQVALAKGRWQEALEEVRRGDMYPDGPAGACEICLYQSLGDAFDRGGMPDSAIVMYERYVATPYRDRLTEDALHLARILQRLGSLHESRGDRQRALHYYSQYVELWKNADPELQPRVMDARQRVTRLQRPSR